jgi:hypothetical protein
VKNPYHSLQQFATNFWHKIAALPVVRVLRTRAEHISSRNEINFDQLFFGLHTLWNTPCPPGKHGARCICESVWGGVNIYKPLKNNSFDKKAKVLGLKNLRIFMSCASP